MKISNGIRGVIKRGLGIAKDYMLMPSYAEKFIKYLNFLPYPGTLNIKVNEKSINNFLSGIKPVYITGFKEGERVFGGLECYLIKLVLPSKKGKRERINIDCAIIIPEKTIHSKDTIEIIAPLYLKKEFDLNEGDSVIISYKDA